MANARALPLAAAALLLALAAPALASVKDGVDMWGRGDYAGAVKQWQGPAAAGDADAEFDLAQAYKLGRGVPQDMAKAEELYREAAVQGHLQAGDNYGLMLFQSGRREQALPWLKASAERGEPRAEYVLGIAHFNGDLADKDWVTAYALMSRAASAGLPQASKSLELMDKYIPLDQRQRGVALAVQMGKRAQQLRESQLAAADLGTAHSRPSAAGVPLRAAPPPVAGAPVPPSTPDTAGRRSRAGIPEGGPVTAGADYADAVTLPSRKGRAGKAVHAHANETPARVARAAKPKAAPGGRAVHVPEAGPWRIQLGAFGQPGNATRMWNRVKHRTELSGLTRFDVRGSGVTRLQAGPFASRESVDHACTRLESAGVACLPVHR